MDDFSDDGLDDLNENVLQELEANALQFTQAQQAIYIGTQDAPLPQRPPNDVVALEDDDLDNTVVIDEVARLPARRPVEQRLPPAPQLRSAQSGAPLTSRPSPRPPPPPRYPASSQAVAPPRAYPQRPPTQARPQPPGAPPSTRYAVALPSQAPLADGQSNIEALQAHVRALEADLLAARGEAALVRSRFEDANKTHEADVARLRKQNAEQLAQQERVLEAAVAAEKTATTELEFTRQDLREEMDKSRRGRPEPTATTPRKKGGGRSNWNVADGFDDMEILPSPTKQQGRRTKETAAVAVPVYDRTPTKGKRKRPAVDSPVMALETHSDDIAWGESAPPVAAGSPASDWRPRDMPFDVSRLDPYSIPAPN